MRSALAFLFAAALPAQRYCASWCQAPGFAGLVVSGAAVEGGTLYPIAIREGGRPPNDEPGDIVAAIVVRSTAPAPGVDMFAGALVLLDLRAPAIIDRSPMSPGSMPGVDWIGPALQLPPGSSGLTIYTQAWLLRADGTWQATQCHRVRVR